MGSEFRHFFGAQVKVAMLQAELEKTRQELHYAQGTSQEQTETLNQIETLYRQRDAGKPARGLSARSNGARASSLLWRRLLWYDFTQQSSKLGCRSLKFSHNENAIFHQSHLITFSMITLYRCRLEWLWNSQGNTIFIPVHEYRRCECT